jgi:hypothetical protein
MGFLSRSDLFAVVSLCAIQAVTDPGVAIDALRAVVECRDEAPGSFVQSPFGMSHPGKPMRVSLRGQTFPVAPIPRLTPGQCRRNDSGPGGYMDMQNRSLLQSWAPSTRAR